MRADLHVIYEQIYTICMEINKKNYLPKTTKERFRGTRSS